MHFELPHGSGDVLLACLCVFAFLKGGREERFATAALAANVAVTILLRDIRWPQVQWAGFAADVFLLIALFALALRSAKFWPMSAAAFQLLATLTHVASLVDRTVVNWAYLTAIVIWTYALMITLGVGVWNHWRAHRYLVSAGPAKFPADTRR